MNTPITKAADRTTVCVGNGLRFYSHRYVVFRGGKRVSNTCVRCGKPKN